MEWTDRQNEVPEIQGQAWSVICCLNDDDELATAYEQAHAIQDNLECAVISEKESDFNANIEEASEAIQKLSALLKAEQARAKKENRAETLVRVADAAGLLRELARDVRELLTV